MYSTDPPSAASLIQRGRGSFWEGIIYGWSYFVFPDFTIGLRADLKLSDDLGDGAGPSTVY